MNHPTDTIAHTTAFVTQVVDHWLEQDTATVNVHDTVAWQACISSFWSARSHSGNSEQSQQVITIISSTNIDDYLLYSFLYLVSLVCFTPFMSLIS